MGTKTSLNRDSSCVFHTSSDYPVQTWHRTNECIMRGILEVRKVYLMMKICILRFRRRASMSVLCFLERSWFAFPCKPPSAELVILACVILSYAPPLCLFSWEICFKGVLWKKITVHAQIHTHTHTHTHTHSDTVHSDTVHSALPKVNSRLRICNTISDIRMRRWCTRYPEYATNWFFCRCVMYQWEIRNWIICQIQSLTVSFWLQLSC